MASWTHLVLLLLAAVGLGAFLAVGAVWLYRISLIGHRMGNFRCWTGVGPDGPWRSGMAQYSAGRLSWWPRYSLGGAEHWSRESLEIVTRAEAGPLSPGIGRMLVVGCRVCEPDREPDLFLLVDAAASAGLTSWLEARPSPPHRVI